MVNSGNIAVIGKDYYANFTKDENNQPDNILEEVNKFKKSQKNREKLIGKWKIIDVKKRVDKKSYLNSSTYADLLKSSDFDEFLNYQTDKINSIIFDYSSFKIIFTDNTIAKFTYIVNINSIDLYLGDVIYNLKYNASSNQVIFENYDKIGIYTDITFAK